MLNQNRKKHIQCVNVVQESAYLSNYTEACGVLGSSQCIAAHADWQSPKHIK